MSDSPTQTIPPSADAGPDLVTATIPPSREEPRDHTATQAPNGEPIHQTRPFEGPDSPTSFPTPDDRYMKQTFLARGGMGEVWTAWDRVLNRNVAVKILREDLKDRSFVASRFIEEAHITGKLEHPGIPPIHDLGTFRDGLPFIAMKLIKGRTFSDLLTNDRPDLAEQLRIFDHICQAVAAAHDKRVIHRDLKPGNVMVGRFNEVQVMDWGLAKVLGELPPPPDSVHPTEHPTTAPVSIIESDRDPSSHTRAGSLLGTPAYMPPEQAKGEVDRTDTRSDVFALGAILCELLTGKPPYWAATSAEIQAYAITAQLGPAFQRLDNSMGEPELIALAKHCLSPNPDDRPADAKQVAKTIAFYRASVEDRLRRSERDRAAAEAKAAEEVNTRREAEARADAERAKGEEQRKRRRVQLALAAAGVLLVIGSGTAAWWADKQASDKDRIERETKAEVDRLENARQTEAFKQKVEKEQREQAERSRLSRNALLVEATLQNVDNFIAADDHISALAALAEANLRYVEGGAEHLATRIIRCRTDVEMLNKLSVADEDLLNRGEVSWTDPMLTAGWVEAFRFYGLDYEKTPPDEWVKRINESRIRERLLLSLDLWHSRKYIPAVKGDPAPVIRARAERKAVRKILDTVDPDAFRMEVRDAIFRADKAVMEPLIEDPRALRQPVRFAIVLGQIHSIPLAVRERVLAPAVERAPNDLSLLIAMSSMYQNSTEVRRETTAQEIRWAQAAVAVRPTSKLAWRHLGRANWNKGNLDDAVRCFKKAYKLDKNDLNTLISLSGVLLRKHDPDAAMEFANRALEINPNYSLAHSTLGNVYDRMGRNEEALFEFDKAIAIDIQNSIENATHFNNRGYTLMRLGKYNEAIRDFQDALRLSSDFKQAETNLNRARELRKGDREPEIAPEPRLVK